MTATCPVGQATEIFTCLTKLPAPGSPYCHTLNLVRLKKQNMWDFQTQDDYKMCI